MNGNQNAVGVGGIPFSNFPGNANVSIFTGDCVDTSSSIRWKVWNKPKNKTMAFMFLLGGGGGGGSGREGSTVAAGGGGGGGSCAPAQGLFPLMFLPDQLFICVGKGGRGGQINSAPGNAGSYSIISTSQYGGGVVTRYGDLLLMSQGGGGGIFGLTSGSASGGVGATSKSQTLQHRSALIYGNYSTLAGKNGGAGGAAAGGNAADVAIDGTPGIVSGGTGGGSLGVGPSTYRGGNFTSTYGMYLPLLQGGLGASPNGLSGANGYNWTGNLGDEFYSTGGTGGGGGDATLNTAGAPGGRGGFGSGGGGGGAVLTGGSIGAGGDGGDGLCVIICF